MQSHQPWVRQSQRVIRMVSELHRMGFQRLRIMPYEYPLAYRVAIAPVASFSVQSGAYISLSSDYPASSYYSASGNEYFGWTDSKTDSARALAEKFVARFPDISQRGRGSDWEYAGWLADLVSVFEIKSNRLPIVMAEHFEPGPLALRELPMRLYGERQGDDDGGEFLFPLPPPGLSTSTE